MGGPCAALDDRASSGKRTGLERLEPLVEPELPKR